MFRRAPSNLKALIRKLSTSRRTLTESKIDVRANNHEPIKFTKSSAYIDYKALRNFKGEGKRNLPRSHNFMLASTLSSAMFYLIFIRDDIDDNEGFAGLLKPVHETVPRLAIPMLEAAIIENRKFGRSTRELEAKLKKLYEEPEKYGGQKNSPQGRVLVEK